MTRYALYFAPAAGSAWWRAGCNWLGRDAETGRTTTAPPIAGVTEQVQRHITQNARHYGFHATLKAPFQLAEGFDEDHLLTMAAAFVQHQSILPLDDTTLRPLGDFLALQPIQTTPDIRALAMRCVRYFDLLRAAPTAAELARRRAAGLSVRQNDLLQRWGYPFTEEEFRLHMTLTDRLDGVDGEVVLALREAAAACFSIAMKTRLKLDALAVFRQIGAGASFDLIARFGFANAANVGLPAPGRLFFFVGPSGAGKDTLLRWVQQRLPADADIVFTQRTITRTAEASECHRVLDTTAFRLAAAAGQFAMQWQANGLYYGIPRGIEAELAVGRDVVISGSREYVPQLRRSYPHAQVIWVEADAQQIVQRIQARGRESGTALLRRLERTTRFPADQSGTAIRLDNSGPIEIAGAKLLQILLHG